MRIKKYINHLDFKDGQVLIKDPFNDNSKELNIYPSDYALYVYQDENDIPRGLLAFTDDIMSFIKDEIQIVANEYICSVEFSNFVGIFDKSNIDNIDKRELLDYIINHLDNKYDINSPWFNTYIFSRRQKNNFEGCFIKSDAQTVQIYVMRNKYRKIIAVDLKFFS